MPAQGQGTAGRKPRGHGACLKIATGPFGIFRLALRRILHTLAVATQWEAIRRRCPGFSARRARARPAHRWTRTYERFGLAGACWLALAPLGHADQGWEGNSLHLTWENDATRGSDRHYTQGAKIRYLSADDIVPKWTQSLSDLLPTPGFEADR